MSQSHSKQYTNLSLRVSFGQPAALLGHLEASEKVSSHVDITAADALVLAPELLGAAMSVEASDDSFSDTA